ncbi:MAG: hypothetical protein KUG82_04185 [Pseudomonadales bacterium]|nr:hypothetical protein [Pseudomonadales bacterium]
MSLRRQLSIIVLFTLLLPWGGCQYAKELEITLRNNSIQNLQEIARMVSLQVSASMTDGVSFDYVNPEVSPDVSLLGFDMKAAANLDGYDDEWLAYSRQMFELFPSQPKTVRNQQNDSLARKKVTLVGGVFEESLSVFLSVTDNTPTYYNPTIGALNGDRVYLHFFDNKKRRHTVTLNTSAPGDVNVSGSKVYGGIEGRWQDTEQGYNLEFKLPMNSLKDEFQIEIVDATHQRELNYLLPKGRVVLPRQDLKKIVEIYSSENRRIVVVDQYAWLQADSGYRENSKNNFSESDDPLSVQMISQSWRSILLRWLNQFYRAILSDRYLPLGEIRGPIQGQLTDNYIEPLLQGKKQGLWQQYELETARVTAAYPLEIQNEKNQSIVSGAVIIEEDSEAILTVSHRAISRLFGMTFLAMSVITLALLVFSGILSYRINRLNRATQGVINAEGEFNVQLTASKVRDEIGDLNRSFVTLQSRLGDYTEYLKSLSGKLSHELRTPLAMVRTSLENLEESQTLDDSARVYIQRAHDGLDRLRYIVTAMSAATRVEQSISAAEKEPIELCELLHNLVAAYQSANKTKRILIQTPDERILLLGNTDLLAQMFDKLLENAIDFTADEGVIKFSVTVDLTSCHIVVSNDGPLLPVEMQHQLFDTLVSIRETARDKAHLGLGLYIVKLIVEFHAGQVSARNRAELNGVEFSIKLPVLGLKNK